MSAFRYPPGTRWYWYDAKPSWWRRWRSPLWWAMDTGGVGALGMALYALATKLVG